MLRCDLMVFKDGLYYEENKSVLCASCDLMVFKDGL